MIRFCQICSKWMSKWLFNIYTNTISGFSPFFQNYSLISHPNTIPKKKKEKKNPRLNTRIIFISKPNLQKQQEYLRCTSTFSGLTWTLMPETPFSKPSFTCIARVLNELHCLLEKATNCLERAPIWEKLGKAKQPGWFSV